MSEPTMGTVTIPMALAPAEIERRFTYHAPDTETRAIHDELRAMEREYAERLAIVLGGSSREASLAFTAFEEAMFWSHAHIARNVGR